MAHLTPEYLHHVRRTYGDLKVLDDIIRYRAQDNPPTPILGYPRREHSADDYEHFTGSQLDQFVEASARYFVRAGFKPVTGDERKTIALLAPSDVDYVVSLFALSRLGYAVLCLSLRIQTVAIVNLLQQTDCRTIAYGSSARIRSTVKAVNETLSIQSVHVPDRTVYRSRVAANEPSFTRHYDPEEENGKIAIIMHSSGSTGLPKPVFLPHRAVLMHAVLGPGMHNFCALPLYHLHGISTTVQAMYMRKKANLFSATLPVTANNVITAIETVRPEAVHVVPYVLGLLAEQKRGVAYLKASRLVTSGAAHTPDGLGDRLTREGVRLGVSFGCTEAGLLGDSLGRPAGDDSWNYIRIFSNLRKFIHMAPLGDDGLHELVYIKGHPALSASNTDEPVPGSFRSRDVFVEHPTIPDIWKYVSRLDDRVTLINGEKVLPLPIEGRIREHELVREAVVVGVDRSIPGLLVFKAEEADRMSDEQLLETIWPSIEDANHHSEGFSQITKDMVRVLPSDVAYPRTDKGNVIRFRLYKEFTAEIDELYARSENISRGGHTTMSVSELESFLNSAYEEIMGTAIDSVDIDLFSAGIDSLKAIQLRRIIQQKVDLGQNSLSAGVVYEHGNIRDLAQHLYCLQTGQRGNDSGGRSLIEQMINKYSGFGDVVILTGVTGTIGAHTLARLVNSNTIRKVYCLVRGADPLTRVLKSLEQRRLRLKPRAQAKIAALTSDLSQADFGVGTEAIEQLRRDVTLILHVAWPVNFNLHLRAFEPHFAGLENLIKFSLSVPRREPARLIFCSSVSTAHNTQGSSIVPEGPVNDFGNAADIGYAQSKLVGEHIISNAVNAGARACVLRIGQVVGDLQQGDWNDKEMIPSMVRSALSMNVLPDLKDHCSWLPVDTVASAILELSQTLGQSGSRGDGPVFYNLVNPHTFAWKDVLVELRASGFDFDTVSYAEWLAKLQESAARGDEERNPAIKLIDYYANHLKAGDGEGRDIAFETATAQAYMPTLRQPPRIIEQGYIRKFAARWLSVWK